MGAIGKPTTQSKVERWHRSLRTEADLPENGTLEEVAAAVEDHIRFYNRERPHYALGLKTPDEAYFSHI